jgi:hypothetical protein
MKNEIQWMSIPKIKRMLMLRLVCLLLSVAFFVLTIVFLFGNPLMYWTFGGSMLIAVTCVMLAATSCVEYLTLNRRLSSGGL